jgi:alpha-1,6-mannosyltransferase
MATSTEPRPARPLFEWAATICFSMLAAAFVSWVRYALSGSLRPWQDGLGAGTRVALELAFGLCAALAGIGYLRALRREPKPSTAATLGLGIAGAVCAACALALTSSDVFQNLVYGRVCRAGLNPFVASPAELGTDDPSLALVLPHWIFQKFIYGPVIAAADCLAGRAGDIVASLAIFKAEMLLLAIAAIAFLPVVRKAAGATAPLLYFAWNPLFLWEIAGQAHNDAVMLLPELGFVAAALAGQELIAVLCLSVAFCAKFSVAPLLGLYFVYLARRSPWKGAALLAVGVAVCAVFFAPWWAGPSVLLAPLPEVGADVQHHARSFTSLLCWLATPLGPAVQAWVYGAARVVSIAALLALAVRAALRARTVQATLHEALVFLLAYDLVAAAWFQAWYVTWLLPLALVDRDERVRYAVAVYSVLSLVQYGIALDPVTYLFVNGIPLLLLLGPRRASPSASLSLSG